MFPFLCEITLCSIIWYWFALFLMQSEKHASKRAGGERGAAGQAPNADRPRGRERISLQ